MASINVCYSTNNGANWSILGSPTMLPNGTANYKTIPSDMLSTASNIEVLKNDPGYIYVSYYTFVSSTYIVWRYNLNTNTWENKSGTMIDGGAVTAGPHGFAINPTNEEEYWVMNNGNVGINHGITFLNFDGSSNYAIRKHPDTRDILVVDNNTMYVATDGGVYKSTDKGQTYSAISEGLNSCIISTVAVAQKPPFIISTSNWHSGFNIYDPQTEIWHNNKAGGDGNYTVTPFLSPNLLYSWDESLNLFYYTNGYNSIGSSVYPSPEVPTYIAGSENQAGLIWSIGKHLIKTINNNASFTTITNIIGLPPGYNFRPSSEIPKVYAVPNEPDRLMIVDEAPVVDRLIFIKNARSAPEVDFILTPSTISTDNGPIGPTYNFGGIVFDPTNYKKFWMTTKWSNLWNVDENNRIVEVDLSSGTPIYTDITYSIEGYSTFPHYFGINNLELDRNTGILYIGTTCGVYYLDRNTHKWIKYSLNLPFSGASLSINHCQGELYAAASTRGAWKAPMIRNSSLTREWIIDQNTTWNDRMNLFCTLVVEPGFTLTVKNELVVYGYQKIIVKQGGTLIVDGASGGKITTECGDLWEGIQVWGDKNKHQYPVSGQYYQGRLILKNNAVVENAKEAIRLHNPLDGLGGQYTTGGIVQATNATIRNVFRGAEFLSYHNFNPAIPSQPRNNVSYFKNVTFELTQDLSNGILPYAFVSMWDVNGIQFLGCRFQNNYGPVALPLDASYAGRGIYTEDANFIVDDYCNCILCTYPCPSANIIHTEFNNLAAGIHANKVGSNKPFTVNNTILNNCIMNTMSTGVSNMQIKNNHFTVGDWQGVVYNYQQVGIGLMSNLTGYTITNNDFIKPPGSFPNLSLGIWSFNTGLTNKIIKNNCFTDMYRGIQAERNNRSTSGVITGLEYQCNVVTGGDYDFYVTKGLFSNPFNTTYGIKDIQGGASTSAGNKFSNNGSSPAFGDFLNNSGNNILYYYNPGDPAQNPMDISLSVLKIVGGPNSCSYCTTATGSDVRTLTMMEQDYINFNQSYLTYKNILQTLIDAGNTPKLKTKVTTSNSNQTSDLRNELLGNSPYLSEDVLMAAADKTDVLPEAILYEILLANPNTLNQPELMKYLKEKTVPLPDWMMQLLEGNKGRITSRTIIENAISYYGSKRAEAITEIITYYESEDSLRNETELRGWYALYDTYQADYAIVESYISEKKYDEAISFLSTIEYSHVSSQFQKINPWEKADLVNYTSFINFYIATLKKDQPINQLDKGQIRDLQIIADASDEYTGSARARGILNFFYGYKYFIEPTRPEDDQPKSLEINIPEEYSDHLDIYPVPATDWVAFSYQIKTATDYIVLEIYNNIGTPVSQIRLGNSSGVYVADVSQYAAGAYHYRISSQGATVFTGTIIVE